MAYSELIKNFEHIRDYMRDFYVYGFKSRSEYRRKSPRSYDNERRRMESWLSDYMSFRQSPSGKTIFLTIDSRNESHNPLYQAFKSKSFTDGDITLHFIIFDLLYSSQVSMTLSQLSEAIYRDYLSAFSKPLEFDESTLRKKLKEYVLLGIITAKKQGRTVLYSRAPDMDVCSWADAIAFFSEAGVVGVPGSFLLDQYDNKIDTFCFKHHYITHALESEIICSLFDAMREQRSVNITNYSRRAEERREWEVIPLKILISVQSGRRYLLAWNICFHKTVSYRLDYISSVKAGNPCPDFTLFQEQLNEKRKHTWGVICDDRPVPDYEHVKFTLNIPKGDEHIWNRLEREKRCGRVTRIDEQTALFEADVYDANEMIPWIRTFICRIIDLEFSNKTAEKQFGKDIKEMCRLYGVGGEALDLS